MSAGDGEHAGILDRGVLVHTAAPLATRPETPRPGGLVSTQLGTTTESILGADPFRTRALVRVKGGSACIANSRQECGAGTGFILDPGEELEIKHRGQVFARALALSSQGVQDVAAANLRVLTGSVPAAGAQFSVQVPDGESWEVIAVRVTLTASATVANRQPQLSIEAPDGTVMFRATANAPITAGLAWAITWSTTGADAGNRANTETSQYPPGLILPADYLIRSFIQTGMQADDQYSAPVVTYYRYPDTFTTVSVLNEGYCDA